MNQRLLRAIIVLLAILPFSLASTQDAAVTLDIIGIASTDLSQVAIHASILDHSERLVSGLGVENFTIGGDLQGLAAVSEVENITDDDLNFATVLVIDTSSSMADRPLTLAQAAARGYIEALEPDDPVAIVTFNTSVRLVIDYTTDRERLYAAIDNLAYGGKTALYDATLRGIELAVEAPLERKAVVILSDGGEYGDVSESSRGESIRAATIHGVPVYAIGLGWSIDRRFLEAITSESNATFYESPKPEELGAIYSNLAFLFRSQYIVTLSADVPADGMRYDFTLNVTTADGHTSFGSATLRAPIPIPLLFLPDDVFKEALTEDTQITVEILADQDIESIEYAVDGEVVSTEETYTIEPAEQQPGEYQLDIRVEDVEGDIGELSAEFEIAALPPTVSDDFEAAAEDEIVDAEIISVDAGGQTEITQVEFVVDGQVVKTDNQAPYDFDLDPFSLRPQEHTLSIRATNAGGQTTVIERTFEVEVIPPRLEIEGLTGDTVVSDTLSGTITAQGQSPIVSLSADPDVGAVVSGNRLEFIIDAANFPPGRNTVAFRAVDEAGAETVQTVEFEVAALPPTVALSGVVVDAVISGPREVTVEAGGQTEIASVEVSYDGGPAEPVEEESFTIPADELGDGEHEALVTVTNEGGETSTIRIPFTVDLPPTPTFTPLPTDTATATATPTDTATPVPTATITNTPVATSTATANITATAQESLRQTEAAAPTDTPAATDTAVPSDTPVPTETATYTAVPTETSTPSDTPSDTPVPTDTATATEFPSDTPVPTDTATNTAVPTDTAAPTNTPVPTDTPSETPVPTDTPTETPIPTDTPTDTPVPTDTPTETPIPTDTPTDTPIPTDTPTDTPVPTDTPTDTPVPTDTPTETPVPTDTATDTPVPTDTETPTATNTPTPTVDVTETAEAESSLTAIVQSTQDADATDEPTATPTELAPAATDAPTQDAVVEPTAQPTLTPVTITEIDAPSADEPETRDTALAIGAVVVGLLLLLILFIISRLR